MTRAPEPPDERAAYKCPNCEEPAYVIGTEGFGHGKRYDIECANEDCAYIALTDQTDLEPYIP